MLILHYVNPTNMIQFYDCTMQTPDLFPGQCRKNQLNLGQFGYQR